MADASKKWWEDTQTDWTQGEPRRAVEVLARAYEQPAAIVSILRTAGVEPHDLLLTGSPQQIWTQALGVAARGRRLLDLAAAVLADPAFEVFRIRLESLLGDRLAVVNAKRAIRYGLPPAASSGPDDVVESFAAVAGEPGDEPVGEPQAIMSSPAGLGDARAWVQTHLDALRRTAMIEVGGRPRGTGFLVGANLLLTAAHVLDSRSWPPATRPADVWAVFDYTGAAGRSLEEAGVRVPVVAFLTGSLPTTAEADGTARDWNAPMDCLDFALLKLGSEPQCVGDERGGRRRGAYQLHDTVYDYGNAPLLLIYQHPLGDVQRVTFIRTPARLNENGTRIKYTGNTLAGSSGSAIIDSRGRLVGLHHYAQDGSNQGIPISAIATTLLSGAHRALFRASGGLPQIPYDPTPVDIDPFGATSFTGRPFVNRKNLRDLLRLMAETNTRSRTLVIEGPSGSGVSYSYLFTAQVATQSKLSATLREAAPDGLVAFDIDLRSYVNLGVKKRSRKVLEDVLMGFRLDQIVDEQSQLARNLTTLRQLLKRELRQSSHQWWVFFDSIDSTVGMKQGGIDELIHALIDGAEDPQVRLRIVLAGREARQFADAHSSWLERDTAQGLLRTDVEDWFRRRAAEGGRAIDETCLATKLSSVFTPSGPLPEPRSLAPALPAMLLEILDGGRGS